MRYEFNDRLPLRLGTLIEPPKPKAPADPLRAFGPLRTALADPVGYDRKTMEELDLHKRVKEKIVEVKEYIGKAETDDEFDQREFEWPKNGGPTFPGIYWSREPKGGDGYQRRHWNGKEWSCWWGSTKDDEDVMQSRGGRSFFYHPYSAIVWKNQGRTLDKPLKNEKEPVIHGYNTWPSEVPDQPGDYACTAHTSSYGNSPAEIEDRLKLWIRYWNGSQWCKARGANEKVKPCHMEPERGMVRAIRYWRPL